MPSMVESLMGLVGPQILKSLASRVGESESAVKTGLQSSAVTLLGSMASKSTDTNMIGQIFSMITGSGATGILGNLASLASSGASGSVGDMGTKLIGMLLGGQQSAATDAIAKASGIRSSSAGSLLTMAAPLVMGFLGQRAKEGNLNASSFASLLSSEMPMLKSMLPAGLGSIVTGLGSAMAAGAGAAGSTITSAGSSAYRAGSSAMDAAADTAASAGSSATRWLLPLLAGLLALGGIYWYMNRGAATVTEVAKDTAAVATTAAKDAASTVTDAAKSALAALGEFFKFKLPNGIELNIPRLGVENKLIGFIGDAAKPIDKTTWFNFDRLLFDTGKATLQASSQEQLGNIAEILKAYPKVNIKIGGYTDNVGDKASNLKLSADRAKNVMAELAKLGIAPTRLAAEGYGDDHPVADNTTEEGRAQNRRIAMRVTAK